MHLYTNLFGLIKVPSYGLMITTGVIIANLVALAVVKHEKLDVNDFIILEGYCLLGAMFGAKLLYLAVSYRYIEWNRLTEPEYFASLLNGGFVFYGGMIGGIAAVFLGGRIHKIDAVLYMRKFIFLIPLIHCFGRMGCFMAGCCYGVPYHGFGAVVFPKGSFAPPGIELFPVQLVEASCLIIIALVIIVLQLRFGFKHTIELYLLLYGAARFILEFYRYDEVRGIAANLSTSQWISMALVAASLYGFFFLKD